MHQPPKGASAHPCGIPRFARIACPLRGYPLSSFRWRIAVIRSCSSTARSASMPRVLLHSSLGCSNVLLNIKVKTRILNWILTLSAIRNITDKDDGSSERAWTPAKSALGQGCPSRWFDKSNGCRRRLRIAVIFRASRRCRRAGLPSCSVEATGFR